MKPISDFKPHPQNPRKISDEQLAMLKSAMAEFGDLSGLVVNRTTARMIGGHQRLKILGSAPIEILRTFAKPTRTGTVAEGVVHYNGERYVYREVHWDEAKEKAAMIAANKQGGDWDLPALTSMLLDFEAEGADLSMLGFSEKELADMLASPGPSGPDIPPPELPADARSIQLVFTTDSLPVFMEQVRVLGEQFGTDNVTATVARAVELCLH